MANDKDFVVNGPVVVGKDTKVTVGSIAAGAVDLSTGNYFTDSPSGDYTYTFANPGDVQSFQIQATGGSEAVAETFSTTIYDGTGATQTITNGLDLAGDGGLVWTKSRIGPYNNMLFDSERGGYWLGTNLTSASTSISPNWTLNSNGYTLSTVDANWNNASYNYASWSFKKQTKFFDIVTYTGDGTTARAIPHNLGTTVGSIFIKRTDGASSWHVYHKNLPLYAANHPYVLFLNTTDSQTAFSTFKGGIPDSSNFYVDGVAGAMNASGETYVAYLFAHDTASDGLIQCGSYTGNGSTDGPEINLGWQPQWVMIKYASRPAGGGAGNWNIIDNLRGFTANGSDAYLRANESAAEAVSTLVSPTATGFKLNTTSGDFNQSSAEYIYMAIRSASAPAITWPTNIEWAGGVTPSTPAEGETDVFTFTTDDGGTTYTGIQSIDNAS